MRTAVCVSVVIIVCATLACSPTDTSPIESAAGQGIRGHVVKLVGDFTPLADPERGQRVPLAVPVHVFRGRVQPYEQPDPKHAGLVKIVRADDDGRFVLPLPAGEYTLVAEIDGKLYLNNWLEDGSWGTVTVRDGEWTRCVIEDVREAEF